MGSKWVKRFVRALGGGSADRDRAVRLDELFYKRGLYDSVYEFFAVVLAEFPAGDPLGPASLEKLIAELSGPTGDGPEAGDVVALATFWGQLAARSDNAYAVARHADALLACGDSSAALATLLDAVEREPGVIGELVGDFEDLARRQGGDAWLRFRLAVLRADLEDLEAGDAGGDGDDLRERYSELLDEHRSDDEALRRIRAVGRDIDSAERRGILPRALVRRGRSRSA